MKQMLIIGFLIIVIAMSGCSEQQAQVQPTTAPPAGDLGIKKDIEISGFAFNPSTITIPRGTSITWTNKDGAEHTIVSDDGNEMSSDSIAQGETYAHTFSNPGTYSYHCGIHPSMKGKVIVE